MKYKNLLFLFVLIIFLVAYAMQRILKKEILMEKYELKMSFPYKKSANFYDPLKIYLSPEYTFLENVYSPLVEYSPDGDLVSAVAESFQWIGNEAHFKVRSNLKTVSGDVINAKDVELSFKRMIILSGNTHGDLKDLLCPNHEIKSILDSCPNLETRENDTLLVMKFNEKKIFLFPMLAAIDFAVIPRKSIDYKNLNIIDYKNTSGPYFVEVDDGNGNIVLSANPHHFHYKKNIPQRVHLIPPQTDDTNESLTLFKQGKVDLITTIDRASHDNIIEYSNQNLECNLHQTLPLRTYTLTFTKKGLSKFTVDERIAIGKKIKELFLGKVVARPGFEPTVQLFSKFSEASISNDQLTELNKIATSSKAPTAVFQKPILGWLIRMSRFTSDYLNLTQIFPNGEFKNVDKVPGYIDFSKELEEVEPDFDISGPDMGFLEDIGLLTHYVMSGAFYLTKDEGEVWLQRYISTHEKVDRIQLMKELHYNTLAKFVSFPIAISPYAAVVRKPWTFNLSKVQASDALWRIQRP